MKVLFADTSFWWAYYSEHDDYRARARRVMTEELLDLYPFQLVTTDYIFAEVITGLLLRDRMPKAHGDQLNRRAQIAAGTWGPL